MKTPVLKGKKLLSSVGTFIDSSTLQTYPQLSDLSIDYSAPVHLSDCSEEWHDNLSEEDRKVIEILQKNK